MATHSSVLAWRIPGTGEPVGLPSMGSHRVGNDCRNLAAAAAGGTSLLVSWSRLHPANAGGAGSIPGSLRSHSHARSQQILKFSLIKKMYQSPKEIVSVYFPTPLSKDIHSVRRDWSNLAFQNELWSFSFVILLLLESQQQSKGFVVGQTVQLGCCTLTARDPGEFT